MRLVERWNDFWFRPVPTSTLAVYRIAVGIVVLAWTLSLLPDLHDFFGRSGILPSQPDNAHWWGVLGVSSSGAVVVGLWAVCLIAAAAVTIGLVTRVATVVLWIAVLSFERRNPWIINSGDVLLLLLTFYLMLAPSGAALSFDRWRRHRDRFWEFPARAVWPLRLVQLQLCVLYVVTVWDKVRGTTWNDGTAVSYALRLRDLSRFEVPDAISSSLLLSNLFTYGTLAVELCLGLLVWNRRARPWVLAAGVALHLAIDLSLLVGFFTLALFAAYLAWVPPETMVRAVLSARDASRTVVGTITSSTTRRGIAASTSAKVLSARARTASATSASWCATSRT